MGEVGFAKNSQYRSDNVELYLSPAPPKWHNDKEILPLLCLQDLANLTNHPPLEHFKIRPVSIIPCDSSTLHK